MKKILLITLSVVFSFSSFSQNNAFKGDGQVFWEEHFDWADPDSQGVGLYRKDGQSRTTLQIIMDMFGFGWGQNSLHTLLE